ncbi:MAG: hypothetical protein IJW82_06810 [Clostridia bacterium]|nr:hypothetical protein [Clostridia bacterium]
MEVKKIKKKILLFQILSFVLTLLPLLLTLFFRWDKYIQTQVDGIKLGIGGILILILFLLKSLDKIKLPPNRLFTYLFLLLMCYLLSNILNDATFIFGMATLGEILDLVLCQPFIKKYKQELLSKKISNDTSKQVVSELKEILTEFKGRS